MGLDFHVDPDGILRLNPLTGFQIAQPPDREGVALVLETYGRPDAPAQKVQCILTPAQTTSLGTRLQDAAYRQETRPL